jgi:hypothetical protein
MLFARFSPNQLPPPDQPKNRYSSIEAIRALRFYRLGPLPCLHPRRVSNYALLVSM